MADDNSEDKKPSAVPETPNEDGKRKAEAIDQDKANLTPMANDNAEDKQPSAGPETPNEDGKRKAEAIDEDKANTNADNTNEEDDDAKKPYPPKPEIQLPFRLAGRAIAKHCYDHSECEQFEILPKDFSDFFRKDEVRIMGGTRLTQEVADSQCILVGDDKCGLSLSLAIPIAKGASFKATISTWVTHCHGNYALSEQLNFGVGIVKYGCGKEQMFSRGEMTTDIDNGVQWQSFIDFEAMMGGMGRFGGFGGLGGLGGGGFGGKPNRRAWVPTE